MIKPGYNILYNGIENTIISWVIKDREKEDLSLLTSRILYFVDKVFLKHINKEYLDDAQSGHRLTFDMLNVVDPGAQLSFVVVDHAPRHIIGGHTAVGPNHADDGDLDVGEDIGRCAPRC